MKGHPATVIEVDGQTLVAMTEFGRKFNIRNKYGLKIGDPILVMFDIRNSIISNMPIQMRDDVSEITNMIPESESKSEVLRPFPDEASSQDPFHPVTDEWSDDSFLDMFI